MLTIHGFPTNSWDWGWVCKNLVSRFHMVVPDLLDYGLSLNAKSAVCTVRDQADMLEALMKHKGISDVHILAHDLGNTVVQELLARQNESNLSFRIESAIFLNGGMIPELHRPRLAQRLLASPIGPWFASFIKREKFLQGLAEVFGKHTRPEGEFLKEFWPAIKGINGRASFSRRIRYMKERKENADRWVPALPEASTKIPMFLINGTDDPVSGAHAADGFEKLVPRAKVARLPGIGHFPQIEDPEAVCELVHKFHDCIVEKSVQS
ncbi:alpha/beta hydrolase [Kordiimonas sp. SCSIO 12603]|uniref:alpha/beta fold hydrolase n=1 Tax=Kordiimonas sp. SCSIO 12603 TaxID=2829596 RepID=UPI002102202E|nr:alpha/beta hydrolase [Kordiimonas sp. SCSIO 12603]UTW58413.1 alpha/beta hydrolase [Kordiimonas sp. SCSIO 12603]